MRDKTPDYYEVIRRTTKDVHERCGMDLDILWDEGKMRVGGFHKVKLRNGLGHIEYMVEHRDLVERGPSYQEFLEGLSAAARKRLTLTK